MIKIKREEKELLLKKMTKKEGKREKFRKLSNLPNNKSK
jgi:hypothetical protein